MKREGVSHKDLMEALRQHGFDRISQVKLGVLEMDGSLSVIPSSSVSYNSREQINGTGAPKGAEAS